MTVFKQLPMKTSYVAVLRDGPEPGTWYETASHQLAVSFDHTPDKPGVVRVTMRDQPFTYEDLVEFMSFFMMLSGWLGRTAPAETTNE